MTVRILALTLAGAFVLAGAGCRGPCGDRAVSADVVREKTLGCPDLSNHWDDYVPDEAVAACAEPADRYCSDGDLKALDDYARCVDELAACEGGEDAAKAFREKLGECEDKREAMSDNCRKALF